MVIFSHLELVSFMVKIKGLTRTLSYFPGGAMVQKAVKAVHLWIQSNRGMGNLSRIDSQP